MKGTTVADTDDTIQVIIEAVQVLGEQTANAGRATTNIVQLQKAVELAKSLGSRELVREGEALIAKLKEDEAGSGKERALWVALHRVLRGRGWLEDEEEEEEEPEQAAAS